MIIKPYDRNPDIERLEALLKENPGKKDLITRQLRNLRAGQKSEKAAAYEIDFNLGSLENWAVLHDLRIEHGGRVAQIDHLLIHRTMIFVLLETKNASQGISVNEHGEFSRWWNRRPTPFASPFAQNERHISVLSKLLDDLDLFPKRLIGKVTPEFQA
jgi:hypothetical protein